jgi:hypothetical protein
VGKCQRPQFDVFKMKLSMITVAVVALAMPASAAEIVAEGDTISITGQIEQDDYAHFRDALTAKPQTRVVILNSPGGHLPPAITIGREIRARKIATVIPDGAFCSSACAMIWLGGIPRDIHGNGRLGFHSARPEGQADCRKVKEGSRLICDEQGNDLMIAWLHETELYPVPKDSTDIGGALDALSWFLENAIGLIMGVAPGEMRWLDRAEAMKMGLIARPEPMPPSSPVPFVCEGIRCPK